MEENKNPEKVEAEKLADIATVVERETSPIGAKKTYKERQKELKTLEKQKKIEEKCKRRAKRYSAKKDKKESQNGGSNGKTFWVATSLVFALFTFILGSLFLTRMTKTSALNTEVENNYRRAFYSAVDYTDELSLNIDKFLVSADRESAQKYLVDVAVDAEMLEDNLQQLPIQDESKFYTAKLVNQVADYAKYLNNKLIVGDSILDEELDNVKRLNSGVKSLQSQLNDMSDKIGNDFTFADMKADSFVLKGFNELENSSMDYPALIYDGPFSDSRANVKAKGLTESEVSVEVATESVKKVFSLYGVKDVNYEGEVSGKMTAYCFTADSDIGSIYVQVSKAGGKVIMFTTNKASNETARSDKSKDSEDISAGENFLLSIGIDDMKAVWTAKADGVSVINFAGYVDGVIIYPDLIKLKVESGTVIGMEAYDYYLNHEDREIVEPTISEQDAVSKVSSHLSVKNVRKALIPIGSGEELCYEVMGENNGATYYAYISATTGKQLQLFKVVEGTEGVLLR